MIWQHLNNRCLLGQAATDRRFDVLVRILRVVYAGTTLKSISSVAVIEQFCRNLYSLVPRPT